MTGQTFAAPDLGTVAFLILLEALLSADNALVLAIMVRHLPKDLQKKALLYGLGGAFVLRTSAILLASIIIGFWWLQLIGAAYLLYLPYKHFRSVAQGHSSQATKGLGFWPTVAKLELVDVAFAVDSVIVAVAVVDTVKNPDKVWVVIAGAMMGVIILRFAASYFIRLLERYPFLDHVAYALVGWAGAKLLLISGHTFTAWYDKRNPASPLPFVVPEMPAWLFWGGIALIAGCGGWYAANHSKSQPDEYDEAKAVEEAFEDSSEPSAETN